jgi:hypothetical protein
MICVLTMIKWNIVSDYFCMIYSVSLTTARFWFWNNS